jgi:hypothetical protein
MEEGSWQKEVLTELCPPQVERVASVKLEGERSWRSRRELPWK